MSAERKKLFDLAKNTGKVIEIPQDMYIDARDVIPPIYGTNGIWAMGEPHSHTDQGEPTYYWFLERHESNQFVMAYGTKDAAEATLLDFVRDPLTEMFNPLRHCPECGENFQATVKLWLSNVRLNEKGAIASYSLEFGETMEEAMSDENIDVYCSNDHAYTPEG